MKSLIVVILVVAAVTGALVAWVLRDEARASARRTAESEAIGFVATPTRWWSSVDEENVEGHTLTFSFVDAAHGVHAHTLEEVTWYDAERSYKVCYDPADPSDFKLYRSDHVCGS